MPPRGYLDEAAAATTLAQAMTASTSSWQSPLLRKCRTPSAVHVIWTPVMHETKRDAAATHGNATDATSPQRFAQFVAQSAPMLTQNSLHVAAPPLAALDPLGALGCCGFAGASSAFAGACSGFDSGTSPLSSACCGFPGGS